jgi:hypothetical protein
MMKNSKQVIEKKREALSINNWLRICQIVPKIAPVKFSQGRLDTTGISPIGTGMHVFV